MKGGTTDGDWLEEIAMREAIRDLTDRERKILSMRFIDGKTQTEVAGRLASRRHRSHAWKKAR